MKKCIVLLAFLINNTCLEVKFVEKTEVFLNDCNSEIDLIKFVKLN